jgi:mannitol/fructose-specific phosphotransferase system IIA component (Ntr-type)
MASSECDHDNGPNDGSAASISDLLAPGSVRLELRARGRDEAIRELLRLLERAGGVPDHEEAFRAVMDREALVSTGVGRNVALPHALVVGLTEVQIALGMSSIGVDFAAPDGMPAHVVFLLLFPAQDTTRRIKILAQLSRLLRQKELLQRLMTAHSSDNALAVLREAERALEQGDEDE